MPRQNRYHPYARQVTASSTRRLPSPPLPPTSELSYTPPPLKDQRKATTDRPPSSDNSALSYHPINPNYIRGITGDGKQLVARSIMQSNDGIFHIEMQVVGYPTTRAPANPGNRRQQKQQLPPFAFPTYNPGESVREHVSTRQMNGFTVEEVRLIHNSGAREGSYDSSSDRGGYSEGGALLEGEPGGVVYEKRHSL